MPFESILVETDRRTATVTLGRAPSGNSINQRMAFELRDACDQLDHNDDVWVVIITGRGDAFCRGTEPSVPASGDQSDLLETLRSLKVAGSVAAIEKPVIAALNGDAIDQGLELALACDIRIASAQARLGLAQVKDGLIPWDGGTQRLPRLVGRSRATEMILTSRIVEAEEALDIGLVSQVLPTSQEVVRRTQEIASEVASHGPIAARYLKEAVLKGMEMSMEQGLRLEADLNFILHSTTDRAEGIRSFLERRTPEYRGE